MSQTSAYSKMPRQHIIAKEGHTYLFFLAAVFVFCLAIGLYAASLFFAFCMVFVAYFFRNPERVPPSGSGLVLAPADGRVLSVDDDAVAPHTGAASKRICIFMSVLNVHINRFPVSGTVKDVFYHPGDFLVASLDKANERNERNVLVVEDADGRSFTMVQIAGLVARRIVCYLRSGDMLEAGARFGLIRFGSRVDLYVPKDVAVAVKKGDRTTAGVTILGRFA